MNKTEWAISLLMWFIAGALITVWAVHNHVDSWLWLLLVSLVLVTVDFRGRND